MDSRPKEALAFLANDSERGPRLVQGRCQRFWTGLALLGAVLLLGILIGVVVTVQKDQQSKERSSSTTNSFEDYEVSSSADLALQERLNQGMRDKIASRNLAFANRFPRADPLRASAAAASRRMIQNLPRPLRQVSNLNDSALSPAAKVSEIMYSLDMDGDGLADPWELHDWIIWVEKIFHRHTLEEQWSSLGRNASLTQLGWTEYLSMVHPNGATNIRARRRTTRDRRRWTNADSNNDNILTKHEFKYFLYPQMSENSGQVLIPEAHEDLDTNMDGQVSLEEFLAAHVDENIENQTFEMEIKYFNETLDADLDGVLDVEELTAWVEPEGFVQAKSEVVYLMDHLDQAPVDKMLSRAEILEQPDGGSLFLSSEVTYFGNLYRLDKLRAQVFQMELTKSLQQP